MSDITYTGTVKCSAFFIPKQTEFLLFILFEVNW